MQAPLKTPTVPLVLLKSAEKTQPMPNPNNDPKPETYGWNKGPGGPPPPWHKSP